MLRARVVVDLSRLRNAPQLFAFTPRMMSEAAAVADSRWSGQMKTAFSTEGGSTGEKWPPLSPKYLAWKQGQRAAGRQKNRALIAAYRAGKSRFLKQHQAMSTRILVLSGVMRDDYSFRDNPGHVAEGVYLSPTRGLINLGARGPKFYGYHTTGTRTMPRRDPLRRTSQQMRHVFDGIVDVVRAHFARAFRAARQAGY